MHYYNNGNVLHDIIHAQFSCCIHVCIFAPGKIISHDSHSDSPLLMRGCLFSAVYYPADVGHLASLIFFPGVWDRCGL